MNCSYRSRTWVLLAIGALVFGGCNSEPAGLTLDRIYGGILTHATDERGASVPGVGLELRDPARRMALGTTGEDGLFEFRYIPPNPYLIIIQPPEGYSLGAEQPNPVIGLVVESGVVQSVPIMVTNQFGQVFVRSRDANGNPLANVSIELRTASRIFGYLHSDANGEAHFRNVPIGSYKVVISPPAGYTVAADQANPVSNLPVEEDALLEVELSLTPTPP